MPIKPVHFAFAGLAMALSACATAPVQPAAFTLPTGLELTLVDGTTLQAACDFHDVDEDMTPENSTCVEYQGDRDVMTTYAQALGANGYENTGGAENVMWFKTPVEPGCRQSLNLVRAPKTDAAGDDRFVIAFIAEPKRCR